MKKLSIALYILPTLFLFACNSNQVDGFNDIPKLQLAESLSVSKNLKFTSVHYLGKNLLMTNDLDEIIHRNPANPVAYIIDTKQNKILKNLYQRSESRFDNTLYQGNRFLTQLTYEMQLQIFDSVTLNQVSSVNYDYTYSSWGNFFITEGDYLYMRTPGDVYKYRLSDLLNKPNPQPLWVFSDTGKQLISNVNSIAVDPQNLYVSGEDTEPGDTSQKTAVYALDKNTGKLRWKKNDIFLQTVRMEWRLNATVATDPQELGVYVAQDAASRLYRLNAATGNVDWGPVPAAPKGCTSAANVPIDDIQVTSKTVVVTPGSDHCIFGVNKQTGERNWIFLNPLGVSFFSKPVMLGDVMYQVTGRVMALDTNTGKLIGMSGENETTNGNDGILAYDPDNKLIWRATGTGVIRGYKPVTP